MSEQAKELRQGVNKVQITGVLNEKNLEVKEYVREGKKQMGITGTLEIRSGKNELHTVRVFAYQFTKAGKENSVFKGLNTVKDEYKSVAEVGKDEATKVQITNGNIDLNEYANQSGEIITGYQNKTNFVNRLKEDEKFEPKANFDIEMFVEKLRDEFDKKTEEETGRVIVQGYVPIYNGVMPFSVILDNDKGGADYARDNFTPGKTVNLYGKIVNFREETVKVTEGGFGDAKEETITTIKREFLATGGSVYEEGVHDGKLFDAALIKEALAKRALALEELKNKKPKEDKKPDGFGGGAATPKKEDLSENVDVDSLF